MIPPWNRRKSLSTRAHQEIIDQVNRNSEFSATGDIHRGQDGTTIVDARGEVFFLRCEAVIIAPENADHTYADPRYRCRIQRLMYSRGTEDIAKFEDQDEIQEQLEGATSPGESTDSPAGWTVTATNLAEIQDPITGAGSHDLPEDSTVVVEIYARRVYLGSDDTNADPSNVIRWFFNSGGLISKGQYQYQTYQMVAQNEAGWDFDSLHSAVI